MTAARGLAARQRAVQIEPPYAPMEAVTVDDIPSGSGWQYEPKWDGFRCLAFRDREKIQLQSKSGRPLARYFPDLVQTLVELPARRFVLDGEIVIPISGRLSFDELLLRVHPAESRVRMLAGEHPATFIVFDLLADERGKSLVDHRLSERRRRLEKFAAKFLAGQEQVRLSPTTLDLATAQKWFKAAGDDLDGLIAKRIDQPYLSGDRSAMRKVKYRRTADCVVGGFRYGEGKKVVGSLLLGLYDRQGLLHHVGFTSSFKALERKKVTQIVEPLIEPPGFTGRAPGGPSRWSTRRSEVWSPLRPKLVVEVQYDHVTNGRFRHGTKFLRWRPDKAAKQCTMDQVVRRGHALRLFKSESLDG